MAYKVLRPFRDSQDDLYAYRQGDIYPRQGYEPSKQRIAELSSVKNRLGKVLIAEMKEEQAPSANESMEYPKHTGGGWYELSNGEKVQGKEEAIKAEQELSEVGDD